jgi:myo-inositol catabolism protein IolC
VTDYFVFAFDHRNSLRNLLSSLDIAPSEQTAIATLAKSLALEGLSEALRSLTVNEVGMLLVDDEYGSAAIARARTLGVPTVVPVERSGQPEFIFEHGEDDFWARFVETGADTVKALVRYNPEGDASANARSRDRLAKLAVAAARAGTDLMLELLVPPSAAQLEVAGGVVERYDETVRADLVLEAMAQLSAADIRPRWWKLEPYQAVEPARRVAAYGAAHARSGCLVLGRGADRELVAEWVATAAGVPGYSGFAIGRTLWVEPLHEFLQHRCDERDVAAKMAANYLYFVNVYRQQKGS